MKHKYLSVIPTALAAFAVGFVYFLFHLRFMQQYLDWDQIVYGNNILNALSGGIPLYNPHHLHIEIGGSLWHKWFSSLFGEAGFTDPIFNNRLKSLLFACLGLIVLVSYLKDLTGRFFYGVAGAFFVGATHGYLHYATKVDTPIYPAAAMIFLLWFLERFKRVRGNKRSWGFIVLLGAFLMWLSVMAHQYMAFAAVLLCVSAALPGGLFLERRLKRSVWSGAGSNPRGASTREKALVARPVMRWSAVVAMAVLGIAAVVGSYFWVGKSEYNLPFSRDEAKNVRGVFTDKIFQEWLFLYETTDMWGSGVEKFDPRAPFRGFTDAFISQIKPVTRFNRNYVFDYNFSTDLFIEDDDSEAHKSGFSVISSVPNLVALFTLVVLAGAVLFAPILWRRYGRSYLFTISALLSFSLFTTYWEAYYFEFWLIPMITMVVLFVMLCCVLGESFGKVLPFGKGGHLPFIAGISLFAAVLLIFNQHYYLLPYSESRRLESFASDWDPNYYNRLFSKDIYRNPNDVYKNVRPAKEVSVKEQ